MTNRCQCPHGCPISTFAGYKYCFVCGLTKSTCDPDHGPKENWKVNEGTQTWTEKFFPVSNNVFG